LTALTDASGMAPPDVSITVPETVERNSWANNPPQINMKEKISRRVNSPPVDPNAIKSHKPIFLI
jgi:hypothetical protein